MRALIIDDCERLRELFQAFLEKIGFQTDGAPDGSVAFKMIQERDYDVIISDMDMPVLNGRELYELIVKHMPHLKNRVMFATGDSFSKEHTTFFKTVACPVLFKPVSLADLKNTVQSFTANTFQAL